MGWWGIKSRRKEWEADRGHKFGNQADPFPAIKKILKY